MTRTWLTITIDAEIKLKALNKYPRKLGFKIEQFLRADLDLPLVEVKKDKVERMEQLKSEISIIKSKLLEQEAERERIEKEVEEVQDRTVTL